MQKSKLLAYLLFSLIVIFGSNNVIKAQKRFHTFSELEPANYHFQLFSHDNRVVLDVRTHKEYRKAHLPGAINAINQETLKKIADTLDIEQPVFVYCKEGDRSLTAAIILADMGFVKVYSLTGGIDAWIKQGYSLEREKRHHLFKP
ncbi:MAG TPA: rhodanese-like domain-containing protein [Bacteroidales bacterium]|nr:rhodanese-like domain-containing protein [Bacteroidales bacterium]